MHCFPASIFLSQKHNKTLSKTIFFFRLLKYLNLDSKQTEVERRGDYKLVCPLVNWELQVSGSSQQEVQTGPESGSLRPPWSPKPACLDRSWTGVPRVRGMCLGSPGTWVLGGLLFWLSTYSPWSILAVLCKCFLRLIITFIKAVTGFPTFYFLTVFLALCSTYYLLRKFL